MICGGGTARVLGRTGRGCWPHRARCADTPGRARGARWARPARSAQWRGMGGRTILVALALRPVGGRGSWRQALALALVGGLLGGVALGAVAGARRTATAYDALPGLHQRQRRVRQRAGQPARHAGHAAVALISSLPGVIAHAAYIGLNGVPLVHGRLDNSFLVNSLNGSLDGEYFGQDRATVLAGRLLRRIDQHGGAHARRREGVRDRRRRHGQLPGSGRWTRSSRPTGTPFTRSFRVAAIAAGPARPGRRVRPGGGEHPAAGGDPAAAAGVLLRVDRPAPGPGTAGTCRTLQKHLATAGRGPAAAGPGRRCTATCPRPRSAVNRTDVIRSRVQQADQAGGGRAEPVRRASRRWPCWCWWDRAWPR